MPNVEIRVKLPNNRLKTGTIELIDPLTGLTVYGPKPVLGRAARNIAAQHGNPNGVATRKYGDTPTGSYVVPAFLKSGPQTPYAAEVYGGAGVIALDPALGEAAIAKANGRTGLLIHSGRQPPVPAPPVTSHLKPTNGCLRMLEADLAGLIKAVKDTHAVFPGQISVTVGPEGPAGGPEGNFDDGDPPPSGGAPLP